MISMLASKNVRGWARRLAALTAIGIAALPAMRKGAAGANTGSAPARESALLRLFPNVSLNCRSALSSTVKSVLDEVTADE